MALLSGFFIFILGAIAGSFLNVCIHRLPRDESIVSPPSHCPRCKTPLKPYDNVPIVSYLVLGGRCRSCRRRISPRYLVVELLTAVCFLTLSLMFAHALPMMVTALVFVCSLIIVFFVDLEHQVIPDEISLGGIAFGIAVSIVYPQLHETTSHGLALARSLEGLVTGGALFWLVRIIGGKVFKKEALGFGDVKLIAAIGALLGMPRILLTTFLAALIGSVIGLSLIAIGRAELGSRLPFGPFICLGAVISFLYGNQFIAWYLSLLR
jgi:leader peptidase (prepilin peptidase)/N-methyltransferase